MHEESYPIESFKEVLASEIPETLDYIQNHPLTEDIHYLLVFGALSQQIDDKNKMVGDREKLKFKPLYRNINISSWSLLQVARTYLLLLLAEQNKVQFKTLLDKLISTADIEELITLHQALALFPEPQNLILHATNGIRSNITSAFNAIALNNPFPEEFFNETAWNQLVLKTLFVDSDIEKVIGLKQRANIALSKALINTAEERYSAGRPIKPVIWYLIGLAADEELLKKVSSMVDQNADYIKLGALLVFEQSKLPLAKEIKSKYQDFYGEKYMKEKLLWMERFDKSIIN